MAWRPRREHPIIPPAVFCRNGRAARCWSLAELNGYGFPVPAGRGGNRQGLQPLFCPPPHCACRQGRGESRRTYGTPSFHFSEQGLKPLPIFIQSLRDETAPNPRTCAKLQERVQFTRPLGRQLTPPLCRAGREGLPGQEGPDEFSPLSGLPSLSSPPRPHPVAGPGRRHSPVTGVRGAVNPAPAPAPGRGKTRRHSSGQVQSR